MAATATSSRPSSLAMCSKESFLAALASKSVEQWTGRRGARDVYVMVSHGAQHKNKDTLHPALRCSTFLRRGLLLVIVWVDNGNLNVVFAGKFSRWIERRGKPLLFMLFMLFIRCR